MDVGQKMRATESCKTILIQIMIGIYVPASSGLVVGFSSIHFEADMVN